MDGLPHIFLCVERLTVCLLRRRIGGNEIEEATLPDCSINKGLMRRGGGVVSESLRTKKCGK